MLLAHVEYHSLAAPLATAMASRGKQSRNWRAYRSQIRAQAEEDEGQSQEWTSRRA